MLGAIADDFTGATDLAGNLSARGFRTIVLIGDDDVDPLPVMDMDAVVIALKTRTAPVEAAVAQSSRALDRLLEWGASQVYFKYCSTFDSTETGNIGPVLDLLIERLGVSATVVVPSFPANGRTVYNGYLFVGHELLEHSTMRDHPLTPMRESDLGTLLSRQSRTSIVKITLPSVRSGPEALRRIFAAAPAGAPTVFVVDAITNDDLVVIASSTSALRLVSGGSGLALGMTGPQVDGRHRERRVPIDGYRVILAGSASASTQRQVAHGITQFPSFPLTLSRILTDQEAELREVSAWAAEQWRTFPDRPVLIYSPPRTDGDSSAAPALETFFARLGVRLAHDGARHFIVAGGETSGAVVTELGLTTLNIGPTIAAGVNWVLGENHSTGLRLNLALKSGNFGSPTIFVDAWELLND